MVFVLVGDEVRAELDRFGVTDLVGKDAFYANFFRIRIVIDDWILKDKIREEDVLIANLPEEHRKEIVDEAMYLARSSEAAGMPGYLGSS